MRWREGSGAQGTLKGPSWVEPPEDQEAGGAVSPSGQEHEPLRSHAGSAGRDGRDLRAPRLGAEGWPGAASPGSCAAPAPAALRAELPVQNRHEHSQHAVHRPLHGGDDSEAHRLQAQGRPPRRASGPRCRGTGGGQWEQRLSEGPHPPNDKRSSSGACRPGARPAPRSRISARGPGRGLDTGNRDVPEQTCLQGRQNGPRLPTMAPAPGTSSRSDWKPNLSRPSPPDPPGLCSLPVLPAAQTKSLAVTAEPGLRLLRAGCPFPHLRAASLPPVPSSTGRTCKCLCCATCKQRLEKRLGEKIRAIG